mmetsp:Transcript_2629/g.6063  ORF Transcript_2629/g.6063 Transcript_2629/m.6063 type:complete len:105 (-) Transcript_2629:94-408(-)
MYLVRPLQKLFKTRQYPGYSDQGFAWENATDAIADDDVSSQGQGGVAGAAAAAGIDEAPNHNERDGAALVAVKEEAVDVEQPSAAMEAETSDPDIDSSDDENSM